MNITVSSVSTGKPFGQNEKAADRVVRMRRYWADKSNAVLVRIGKLLSFPSGDQHKTLAEGLVQGVAYTLDSVTLSSGEKLPIVPPQVISLKTVVHGWGCPACRSAHGSGTAPSREEDSKHLASNQWYYNPVTRQIHVISTTCRKVYAADLGVTDSRFLSALPVVSPPAKPATAKA